MILFEKSATPDQVRGRHFGIMLRSRPWPPRRPRLRSGGGGGAAAVGIAARTGTDRRAALSAARRGRARGRAPPSCGHALPLRHAPRCAARARTPPPPPAPPACPAAPTP